MNNTTIEFPCVPVKQPLGEFYIGSIPFKELIEITKVDIRRIEGEKGFETYLGIQRPKNERRVKEIAKYVTTEDACFPTAVILAVSGNCVSFNSERNVLTLSEYIDEENPEDSINYDEIANVLDGQHRIEGLKKANIENDFEINVSIFIDIDIADQAYLFSTINLAQTKVNKSLVYDLFSLAKRRSPQKTCHEIAVALDSNKKSPFHGKIKRLGVATDGKFNETITQATFVQSLLKYITNDPVSDRNLYLKGSKPKQKNADELKKYIFANMFINEKDLQIVDIIWNYFDAVKKKWPEAWDFHGRGNMLNKTNGFRALFRFMRPVYLNVTKNIGDVPSVEEFFSVLQNIDLKSPDFTIDEFKPGSSGEGKLYRTLMSESGLG